MVMGAGRAIWLSWLRRGDLQAAPAKIDRASTHPAGANSFNGRWNFPDELRRDTLLSARLLPSARTHRPEPRRLVGHHEHQGRPWVRLLAGAGALPSEMGSKRAIFAALTPVSLSMQRQTGTS